TGEQARLLVGGETEKTERTERTEKTEKADRTERTERLDSQPSPSSPSSPSAPSAEFDDFLSEISATVAQQVDAWRAKVGAAVLRWQGEGFRTAQLEALLEQEIVADPERALREFDEDVERLQSLRDEAAALSSDLAGSA